MAWRTAAPVTALDAAACSEEQRRGGVAGRRALPLLTSTPDDPRARHHGYTRGCGRDGAMAQGAAAGWVGVLRDFPHEIVHLAGLNPNWLGDCRRLKDLVMSATKARGKNRSYVSHSDIDLWTPRWAGLGLPQDQRRNLLKRRTTSTGTLAQFLGNSSASASPKAAVSDGGPLHLGGPPPPRSRGIGGPRPGNPPLKGRKVGRSLGPPPPPPAM